MELNAKEEALLREIDAYAKENGFAMNPDTEAVHRVIRGLVMLEEKKGARYCPCRLTTGDPDTDRAIVCPCKHHAEEIAAQGMCHCQLLVSTDYAQSHS